MNRPIKFRAWQFSNKKMRYDVEHLPNSNDKNIPDWEASLGVVADNPDLYSLMQFTGLLDRLGKEIYEGDIVKFTRKTVHDPINIVCWGEGKLRWMCKLKTGKEINSLTNLVRNEGAEVIGNTYENPNLLKQ